MASNKTTWFQRKILFKTPLYVQGACGNYHKVWEHHCRCWNDKELHDIRTGLRLMSRKMEEEYTELHNLANMVSKRVCGDSHNWHDPNKVRGLQRMQQLIRAGALRY